MPFAGFDSGVYPGDEQMQAAASTLPYGFCGYYLTAPCHPGSSWMGTRARLVALGWKCLIIYVGQQVPGVSPCHRSTLTASQGVIDANDAAAKAAFEGFPNHSSIYLDIEAVDNTNPNMPALKDYVHAWVTQLLQTNYRPAIYCHKKNAPAILQVVSGAAGGSAIRFWVVGSGTIPFSLMANPSDSGVTFATAWQCPTSINKRFGSVQVNIDEDFPSWRIRQRHEQGELLHYSSFKRTCEKGA
jgi:hypothetical protein